MTFKERGRVLSAANEKGLKTAIGGLHGAMEAIKGILAQVLGQEEEPEEDTAASLKAKPKTKATKEALAGLAEAANTGEWLESRIHLMFTEIADNLFGDGRLTRDERKALSHGIGQALDAFRTTIEADAMQLYHRERWKEPILAPVAELAQEAGKYNSGLTELKEFSPLPNLE